MGWRMYRKTPDVTRFSVFSHSNMSDPIVTWQHLLDTGIEADRAVAEYFSQPCHRLRRTITHSDAVT